MALGTYCISIETPVATSLGASLNDIRPWLDRHKIEPVELTSQTKNRIITLDIRFRSADEAQLFERDFALA
jgi:hypothetical protein